MRYFIRLAFDGHAYHGWQRQLNQSSVQQAIEEVLQKYFKEEVRIHGCGRTDAGVHAEDYYAHWDTEAEVTTRDLQILNKALPRDISFSSIFQVPHFMNAQRHAKGRRYRFRVHCLKNGALHRSSTLIEMPIEFSRVQEALPAIIGLHDFRAFCKTPERHNSTVMDIYEAECFIVAPHQFEFQIYASHFLRGFMRIMIHTLCEVGAGSLSLKAFKERIESGQSPQCLTQAAPQGLALSQIDYDWQEFGLDPKS